MGIAAGLLDAFGHLVTGIRLAAGDHDLGTEFCQQLRGGAADAAAGAGDDGHGAGQIERGVFHGVCSLFCFLRCNSSSCPGLSRASTSFLATAKTWMAGTKPGHDADRDEADARMRAPE
jgi:hypothetical protein